MTASASSKRHEEKLLNDGRDIGYQQREWVAQRFAWVAMLLVVAAALFGLLGASGRLSSTSATAGDGSIVVEYDRISRYHYATEMVVEVDPTFVVDGAVRLWIDAGYAGGLTIESILPEPERTELEPGRIAYVFAVSEPAEPLRIVLRYENDSYWRADAELGLVNGESVSFTQIVLP